MTKRHVVPGSEAGIGADVLAGDIRVVAIHHPAPMVARFGEIRPV
ncbi:MAG: hypothetical protein R6V02_07220 [Candidatus Aminicenantes bacterium]